MYVEDASDSEYQLWPVMKDPNVSTYTDPNIIATATAFNAAYSYLMLLLQNAWRCDGQKKKTLVIGGMPALMHGVLKPIATFLAGMCPEFGSLIRIIDINIIITCKYNKKLPSLPTQTRELLLAIMNSLVSPIRNSNCLQLFKQLLKPFLIATD
ncbi:hypothetical protein C1645_29778 [Glomus cerebriforme]|uniref:Uncharacterized protein n=1 Tax=Glomus cerebriforme TaxID=658196 RepID=A0A397TA47_9GLOM|nr:hypothetical protein C1645_29778 [Glomus cerebriforme]